MRGESRSNGFDVLREIALWRRRDHEHDHDASARGRGKFSRHLPIKREAGIVLHSLLEFGERLRRLVETEEQRNRPVGLLDDGSTVCAGAGTSPVLRNHGMALVLPISWRRQPLTATRAANDP